MIMGMSESETLKPRQNITHTYTMEYNKLSRNTIQLDDFQKRPVFKKSRLNKKSGNVFSEIAEALSQAERALGAMVPKICGFKDVGYNTYA